MAFKGVSPLARQTQPCQNKEINIEFAIEWKGKDE
jgi:hypothetical protein